MQESIPYPGLGVVFNIDALEEAYAKRAMIMHEALNMQKQREGLLYGYAAWRIFMRIIHPRQITPCILLEGDTELTLQSYQNEFCIAVYGPHLDLETLRQPILGAADYGLAPFHRRLIEKVALDRQPLVAFGCIDSMGRLVTEQWTRREHDLCKEAGWPYAPKELPAWLDPNLTTELATMRRPPLE